LYPSFTPPAMWNTFKSGLRRGREREREKRERERGERERRERERGERKKREKREKEREREREREEFIPDSSASICVPTFIYTVTSSS